MPPLHSQLQLKLIIFDWDGTAVPDRFTAVPELVEALETILNQEVFCAIITGTAFEAIEHQCTRYLSPGAKSHLFVCTNRGSEVTSFSKSGEPLLRYRRLATSEENLGLDLASHDLQSYFSKLGLKTEIISQRLNRRKIDLIPTPRWKNPKKSESPLLLEDLQVRLRGVGITNGIAGAVKTAKQIASESLVSDLRVTTDLKHIEIGLTDKSDSVRWLKNNLIDPKKIDPRSIAIIGDELEIAPGLQGSDALMQIAELPESLVISVGLEYLDTPHRTPDSVQHLPGGPDRFLAFLREQIDLAVFSSNLGHSKTLILTPDPDWIIEESEFVPAREREMEVRFALGNGRLGVRGAAETPIPISQPDLFISGIYSQKITSLPYSELLFFTEDGRKNPFGEIVAFPFPFQFRTTADNHAFDLSSLALQKYERLLDLKKGILWSKLTFQDEKGRQTTIRTFRLASLSDPRLLVQEIEVTCENYSCEMDLNASMGSDDFHLNYPHLILEKVELTGHPAELFSFETKASLFKICIAARIACNGEELQGPRVKISAKMGEPIRIQKLISVITSRDTDDPYVSSTSYLSSFAWEDIPNLIQRHIKTWDEFWKKSDIEFEGNHELTLAQRFNLYHLRIATDHDPNSSIGARGLTGRAYEGHIFWDTEIFMFPFYLCSNPEQAKALLFYRHHTLPGAKARAKLHGFQGAFYPWESTVNGEDVTPLQITLKGTGSKVPIYTGTQQIHTSADIAYAVWHYWLATHDTEFLLNYGAEILFETAKFWKSRVSERLGKFHILGVIGPDEYHFNVDDNAFTNGMAKFNLEKAVWVGRWMRTEFPKKFSEFNLTNELEEWLYISENIVIPQPNSEGVIEQFSGYFKLRDLELKKEDQFNAPFTRLLEWEEINHTKIIKQADVLMLFFLFPESFSQATIEANYRYYEPKTDHGSSLSPCIHAAIAARAGHLEQAWTYWEQALKLDLHNSMKNTSIGIHIGCMGGAWQALLFHILKVGCPKGALKVKGPEL